MARKTKFFEWDVLQFLRSLFSTDDPLGGPFVTIFLILLQVILYLGWVPVPWDQDEVCVSPHLVLRKKEYWRLWAAPLEHADEMHLLYNMFGLLKRGATMEKKLGHLKFVYMVILLTSLTSGAYVYLSMQAYKELKVKHFYYDCAIGFSGVMFALKTIANADDPGKPYRRFFDFLIPTEYVVWPEYLSVTYIACILCGISLSYLVMAFSPVSELEDVKKMLSNCF